MEDKKCTILLKKSEIRLGGHTFKKIDDFYHCVKCPLIIDQVFLDAIIKKQEQN